jgi:replicative DNA helicase
MPNSSEARKQPEQNLRIVQRTRVGEAGLLKASKSKGLEGALLSLYSEEKEHALVAAVFAVPDAFPLLLSIVEPEDFFLESCAYCWRICAILHEGEKGIDIINVSDMLRERMPVQADGVIEVLARIIGSAPTLAAESLETWAHGVADLATRRRMFVLGGEITAMSVSQGADASVEYLIDDAVQKLHAAAQGQRRSILNAGAADAVQRLRDKVDKAAWLGASGVLSGWPKFDQYINRFQPGELSVFGGYSGHGKTTWMLSMIYNMLVGLATQDGFYTQPPLKVVLFTLEMTSDEVVASLASTASHIPRSAYRTGQIPDERREDYDFACQVIGQMPLMIYDKTFFSFDKPLTPARQRRVLQVLKSTGGCDIAFVDGLWLMQPDKPTGVSFQDVGRITKGLIDNAEAVQVPIVAMHQFRDSYSDRMQRGGKKETGPVQSDFADSSAVRKDSQVMGGLHNPTRFKHNPLHEGLIYMYLFKNRNNGNVPRSPIGFKYHPERNYYTEV